MNTELERKAQMIDILKGKTQNEEFGNLAVLPAGRYNCVIEKVYERVNTNNKLFFGIKSTILSGDNKKDFVIECIYLNDNALERGIQRIRNILGVFQLPDITEEDIKNNNLLSRLSEIVGNRCYVNIGNSDNFTTYSYERI